MYNDIAMNYNIRSIVIVALDLFLFRRFEMNNDLVSRILYLLTKLEESEEVIAVRGELYKFLPVERVEEVWDDIDPDLVDVHYGDEITFHDRADENPFILEHVDLDNDILGFRSKHYTFIRRVISWERYPEVAKSQRRRTK